MDLGLDKSQALLLKSVFAKIKPFDGFSLKDFSFSQDPDDFYTSAMARIKGDLSLCVSLPKSTKCSFICISDADRSEIAKVVASIQSYHEKKHKLGIGHTIPLTKNEYASKHSWYAALILSVDTLVDGFDETLEGELPEYKFYLVCFISGKEYQIKIEKGLNALLDDFEAEGKNIVSFFKNPDKISKGTPTL